MTVGLFGASTGAAAALIAAAERPAAVGAVVSRGGRPDLAEDALERVAAPTLLIVGGRDDVVIQLNREAYARLRSEKEIEIVPGATHLFEEPGTLDEVSRLARDWFVKRLT
jgi:pimeloyl-ACP methyl ester carboxylesterase